jgi:hypothetical protein
LVGKDKNTTTTTTTAIINTHGDQELFSLEINGIYIVFFFKYLKFILSLELEVVDNFTGPGLRFSTGEIHILFINSI